MNQYILINTAWRYIITAFFIGAVFGCFCAYVWTDDARIEQEVQLASISKVVKHHYQTECRK